MISAIGGTGGTGKTWAHRNLHRFPDGHHAVDPRGSAPATPATSVDVLGDFFRHPGRK